MLPLATCIVELSECVRTKWRGWRCSDGHGHGITFRTYPRPHNPSSCMHRTLGGPAHLLAHRHTPFRSCRRHGGTDQEGDIGGDSGRGKGTGGIGGERRSHSLHSRGRPSGRVKQRRTRGRRKRQEHIFGDRRGDRGGLQRPRGRRSVEHDACKFHSLFGAGIGNSSSIMRIALAARVVGGRRLRWARGASWARHATFRMGHADEVEARAYYNAVEVARRQRLTRVRCRESCPYEWTTCGKTLVRIGEATNLGPPHAC